MKKFNALVLSSTQELRKTKNLASVSMLLAMMCVMNIVGTVYITQTLKVSFVYIPFVVLCMLFGPVIGGICGALSDVLNYIIKPMGTFFPGFTLTAVITGIIYGLMFYNKKITLKRCILAQLLISIIADLILNTFWLTILYGNGFFVLLPARIWKEVFMFIVKVPTMFVILKTIEKIKYKII